MSFSFAAGPTQDSAIGPDARRTGDAYATFLLGVIDQNSWARYTEPQNVKVDYYAAYFQDDWRVTGRLTLNLGLRWEYETPPWDTECRLSRLLDLGDPIPEMQSSPPRFPAEVLAYRSVPQCTGAWHFTSPEDRGIYNTSARVSSPRLDLAFRLDRASALRYSRARFVTPVVSMTDTQRPMELYGFTVTTNALPLAEGRPQAYLRDPFPPDKNPLILPRGKGLGRYQNLGDSAVWSKQDFERPRSDRLAASYQRELPQRILLDITYYSNWIRSLWAPDVNMAPQSQPDSQALAGPERNQSFLPVRHGGYVSGPASQPRHGLDCEPPAAVSSLSGPHREEQRGRAHAISVGAVAGAAAVRLGLHVSAVLQLQPRTAPRILGRGRRVGPPVLLARGRRGAPPAQPDRKPRFPFRQGPAVAAGDARLG